MSPDYSQSYVVQAFGQPDSTVVNGNNTVYNYPGNTRIEFVNGKVVSLWSKDASFGYYEYSQQTGTIVESVFVGSSKTTARATASSILGTSQITPIYGLYGTYDGFSGNNRVVWFYYDYYSGYNTVEEIRYSGN